ncbi:Uncharacterised protein [Streptococcus pneumoniae]|nr:hypothetical protein [Streptococcus pneumoniae]MDS8542691.1 hypothetical protein [Streptococcus pneumoniae]MDT6209561.1 hypothetical protein [Streptococcus pneumoniae]VSB05568.1 Uncharacterised protein [Streptococcus pneumoniae]
MSSEQQERQALQYAERSTMFTVRVLLKFLEWSARQALAQDSAYKIGVQKLEELLQSPYAIEWLNISKDILDKPIDVEKFKELMESENLPIAISWQGDYLYFYAKDKYLLDKHLLKHKNWKYLADKETDERWWHYHIAPLKHEEESLDLSDHRVRDLSTETTLH